MIFPVNHRQKFQPLQLPLSMALKFMCALLQVLALAGFLVAALGGARPCWSIPQSEENDIPKVMNAAQYVDYGNKKYYTGHYEAARECFKRAAKQEPSSEAGKQAKIFLRSLVPRYPVTVEAEYKRNCAWQTLHDKGMETAIPMFEACTKAYPKFEVPFYDLACIYLDSKNTGLAVGYAAKALAINPEYSNAWLAIGNARLLEKKYPAAKNSAEKALQCNPYNHNAQKMLVYIRERMH